MRAMLVTTPNRQTSSSFPPIGAVSLLHYLRKNGIDDFEFYNIDVERPTFEDALEHIVQAQPTVLGISAVVSTAYAYTKKLTLAVKARLPDTLVVVGGNLAASAEILLRQAGADICVLGEGEVPFLEIVRRAESTTNAADYADIPGLMILDKDGKLVNTGFPPVLSPEDTYDFQWADLRHSTGKNYYFLTPYNDDGTLKDGWLDLDARALEPHRRDKKVGFLPCVKGCVARCTFCHRFDKGIRHMPIDSVMHHMDVLTKEHNVGFIRLAADTFAADWRWAEEFCKRIKEYDVLWQATGIRANSVNPERIALMKDSGCVSLVYGNETGSERMLQIMEKKLTLEDNYNAMEWTVDESMYTGVQLVLGMPGECPETIDETIEYSKHVLTLSPAQDPNNMSINYAQALPGTPLYEYGRHKGLIGNTIEAEEQYLFSISDQDAHDEHSTLNFTDYPKLECLTWRPKITVSVNYAYVQKYGLTHYLRGLSQLAGGYLANRKDSGYAANPKRLVEMGMADPAAVKGQDAQAEAPHVPSLISLLLKGRFGLAMICHPVLFYRMRAFLPVLVLANNTKIKGLKYGLRLAFDYLAFSLLPKKKSSSVEYKSLRKTVNKDMGELTVDSPEMTPLRKGR